MLIYQRYSVQSIQVNMLLKSISIQQQYFSLLKHTITSKIHYSSILWAQVCLFLIVILRLSNGLKIQSKESLLTLDIMLDEAHLAQILKNILLKTYRFIPLINLLTIQNGHFSKKFKSNIDNIKKIEKVMRSMNRLKIEPSKLEKKE